MSNKLTFFQQLKIWRDLKSEGISLGLIRIRFLGSDRIWFLFSNGKSGSIFLWKVGFGSATLGVSIQTAGNLFLALDN